MKKIIYSLGIFLLLGMTNVKGQALATLDYLTHSNCAGDLIGTIGIIPVGNGYTFQWVGPSGFSSDTQNLNNLMPGTYTVTVTEPGGQTSSDGFVILSVDSETTVNLTVCESDCSLWQNPFPCENGTYETVHPSITGCDSLVYYVIEVIPEIINNIGIIGICGNDCITIAATEYCEEGDYTVAFVSVWGCDSLIQFSISLLQSDIIQSITNDTVLCDPTNFQLEVVASDAVSYEWFPTDNLSCSNCPNPTVMPLFSDSYFVIVTDANGCTDEASVYVEIPFGLDWGLFPWSNSPVCEGENLLLESQIPNNIVTWVWSGPNGFVSNSAAPVIPNATIVDAGIYSVTVTDVNGCSGVADFDVIVNESPIADAGPDMELTCLASSVILDASNSSQGPNYNYLWTNATITIIDVLTINADVPETYTFLVTDITTGCSAFDEAEVTANTDLFVIAVDIPEFCIESTIDICATITDGSGNFQYEWSYLGVLISIDQCFEINNFTTDEIGNYEVVVTDLQNGCSALQTFTLSPSECVWPGDTDTNKVVNNFDLLNIGLAYDSLGPIRPNASLDWLAQPATDWTQLTPDGINYKNIDCDGNGIINADDTLAITQNWGLTHNLWSADDRDMGTPFYVERDTFIQDMTYAIPVILGEEDFPAEEVYGLAFTLVFDTSIVASNASINFENSWLGGINSNMIAIQKTTLYPQGGRIDAGITRIDGQNMTGFGQMGTFFITIEDIIFQVPPGGEIFSVEKELIFKIENVKMIGFNGEEIAVDTAPQTSVSTATNSAVLESQIQVFPNPMSDVLTINSPDILMENVEIFNIAGQPIFSNLEQQNQLFLNTNSWSSGTYFIKIQTKEGIVLKKIIK